jgi:nicotinamide riboside kinase
MPRILLVFGDPANGKSTLANKLKAEHRFEVVWVDDVYVEWVQFRCPRLYFDDLDKYILHASRFKGKRCWKHRRQDRQVVFTIRMELLVGRGPDLLAPADHDITYEFSE